MRHFHILLISCLSLSWSTSAQTLGEFEPKKDAYGMNKLDKDNSKRIYIAGFNVHYQVYNEKQKFKQGGYVMGGGQKGDAMAEVSVGLQGLDEKTLQDITNKLYQDFVGKLKAKGMTIITADEAAKTETYDDFERIQGGKLNTAEIPGTVSTAPAGYEYFVKGIGKNGKTKKAGFLGNEQSIYPKLSKELNDAIISKVDIAVLFVRDGEAFQGSGAKLKVKTDLRIVSRDAITMTSDAVIKMKGQNSVTPVASTVAFYHGKMGMGSTTSYVGALKKDLEINGVVDESKVTSFAKGSTDMTGSSNVYATFYSVTDGSSTNSKVISVDATKYGKGVYDGAAKFLNHHTDAFLSEL
jgi:hypothetical protein